MVTLKRFCKKEPVLICAAVCMLLSIPAQPPGMEYLEAIDFRVLALLFCLMAVVAGFQRCGLFELLAQKLLSGKRPVKVLVLSLVMLPFFVSMLVTNDVALITFVPFAILVLEHSGQQKLTGPVVVLQTIAANLGSMATPVGNPQNLFLYSTYGFTPGQFFQAVLPYTAVSFVCLAVAALCCRGRACEVRFGQDQSIRKPGTLAVMTVLFLLCLLCVFRVLPYGVVLALVCLGLLICDRSLFKSIDYALLATFVCFFIFADNIGAIPAVQSLLESVLSQSALLASAAASQFISNVPAAVLLSGFTQDGTGLLLGTDLGGLGTPIASLASLISLKAFLKAQPQKAASYVLLFLVANVIGLVILLAFARLLGAC